MYARNAQESRKNRFRPTGRRFLTDHMHGKLLYPAFRPADVPINSLGRRLQIRRKTMGVTDSTDEWTDRLQRRPSFFLREISVIRGSLQMGQKHTALYVFQI
jgi:hypothetical protein